MSKRGDRAAHAPGRRRWWRMIWLPAAPDVLGLLVAQGEATEEGLVAFTAWSRGGGHHAGAAVDTARKAARQARRELLEALRAALSTPLDQEDLYTLSERVDRVLTQARNALREADILDWTPDRHAAAMADRLVEGTRALVTGFRLLHDDPAAAGRQSDAASKAVEHVERDYREAMAELLKDEDLRAVLASADLYRRYVHLAEAIVAVADRLWYTVLRGG